MLSCVCLCPVQSFQLCSNPVTSPVYCLRFSSSHLYAALANTLQILDFSQSRVCR